MPVPLCLLPLGNEIDDGKKQKGLVGRAVVGPGRIAVRASVGSKIREILGILIQHGRYLSNVMG